MFYNYQNMEDDCDFAAVLKQLDALDAKHYSPQRNKLSLQESIEMSVPLDTHSNASDFDNSDEDLASLLADDEDDIFTKKPFGTSSSTKKLPDKKTADYSPEKPAVSLSSGTGKLRKDSFAAVGKGKSSSFEISPKRTVSKSQSKEIDELESDALDDILSDSTLPSFLKSSPVRRKSKSAADTFSDASSHSEDVLKPLETDNKPTASRKNKDSFFDAFFKNLSSPKDSPEKIAPVSLTNKKSEIKGLKDDDDDILKSLSSGGKNSPPRKRKDSYFDSFLKNISPKNSPKKSLVENEKNKQNDIDLKDDSDIDGDDDDLLKSLDSDEEISPRKRTDSFAISFLKSTSPKNSPKKSLFKNEEKKESDAQIKEHEDEDIFGKSSSNTNKNSSTTQKTTIPDKKKTLLKQVSFKGLPDSSPENSPVKENPLLSPKKLPESETKNKPMSQPRRTDRMGASNKDDTDWLNFFKESPKKTQKPTTPVKDNTSERRPSTAADFKSSASRRRSSSAEWLGLSESDIAAKASALNVANELGSGDPGKLIRPKTTPEPSSRRKMQVSSDLSWLSNDKGALSEESRNVVDSNRISAEGKKFPGDRNVSDIDEKFLQGDVRGSGDFEQVVAPAVELQDGAKRVENRTPFTLTNDSTIHNLPVITESSSVPTVRALEHSGRIANEHANSLNALQAIINNLTLERDQLIKSSEATKQMYEQRIETVESLHKNQLMSSEESIILLENKLKSEMENQIQSYEAKLNVLQGEKKQSEKDFKDKLEDLERQNLKEIERLKELHNQSISLMKKDHEDALQRLTRLKEQEIEAVLSTQMHSKSLQQLTEQLEARASKLASLQSKVEERNQANLKEKQVLLEAKERDLKNLQNRVERQLEEGDAERSRLQQLVLRLESRLQKYTIEGEEDRWEVQQMKARLSVQQKHLDEEYKLQLQQVEREKEKLRLAQDSLLHEQKTVLVQLAQERQQLMREKMDMESVAKKLKEEENIFRVKRMKEESYMEGQKQFIEQEGNKLRYEKNSIKQEADLLEHEKESLQRERQLLHEEKLKINEFSFKVKRRENEIEMMAMVAREDKERSEVEHASALKIKAEQQTRMQQIAQKMQEVMEKEQQILVVKEKLSEEREDLENKKKSIVCNKCKLSLGLRAPPINIDPSAITAPIANLPLTNGVSNHLETFRHDPSLLVWYITSQRDREYLQGELSYLKSLKESSKTRKKL